MKGGGRCVRWVWMPSVERGVAMEQPRGEWTVHEWDQAIEAIDPPALLLVIESRMSTALKTMCSPDDVWQEAMLHAWRDRHRCEWRGRRAFRNWILSVIDNRIRDMADYYAALKRGGDHGSDEPPVHAPPWRKRIDLQCVDGPGVSDSNTPSRVAILRERAGAIRSALAALSDEDQEVVRLRLIEQLPVEQIAERLHIGISAVRHRFRRGAALYASGLRLALRSHSAPVTSMAPAGSPPVERDTAPDAATGQSPGFGGAHDNSPGS
ncbi:MAG: sigma-70 family RNA polymerase sigma factor [Phycisphaeraceae bacterium]|nr:sigma-70 family RNA polymerase sigma factor [Phycisphaeraceae bacterium]